MQTSRYIRDTWRQSILKYATKWRASWDAKRYNHHFVKIELGTWCESLLHDEFNDENHFAKFFDFFRIKFPVENPDFLHYSH